MRITSGLGTMTWSPLACGFLTGKYDDGVPFASRAALKVGLGLCVVYGKILLGLRPTPN